MMIWEVVYTHDRANGMTWAFEVEAPDEERAIMRAGMARAESFVGWWERKFWSPQKLDWERISVTDITDKR
jgi:hypothetical protein